MSKLRMLSFSTPISTPTFYLQAALTHVDAIIYGFDRAARQQNTFLETVAIDSNEGQITREEVLAY